ncbi:MAG TPA: malate dehydrogenase [Candidatus Akkermansia intestinavium]|nr:malate dehydrogenase [Candidatus Akkermansia intestinavium]
MSNDLAARALNYHEQPRPGKLEVLPCKSCFSIDDLTLAYSPGVAEPCMEIARDPALASRYTGKSNLVGVISNGTAVLGLGNIGAQAAKPVMEGKGLLFKIYADVDVFDIELDIKKPETLIEVIKTMEPTFGAINLEDIKAPECFIVEQRLREEMNIPVFHDDQHGTAVISGAALLNAAHLTGRLLQDMKCVVSGAGAAGIACAKFYMALGIRRENIFMFDSKGLIHTGRLDLHPTKAIFAQSEDCTLEVALEGADIFLGLSKKGLLKPEMVKSMAPNPIIFACANPDPEITYEDAKAARPDCIMGSGRSDWPNQVNNVSCFPYIFRAALDVQATSINEAMKIAAARALADLAREEVPAEVVAANGGQPLEFGRDYVIPKPFDPRMIEYLCPAIAEAAVISGVARCPMPDKEAYKRELKQRVARVHERTAALVQSYRA